MEEETPGRRSLGSLTEMHAVGHRTQNAEREGSAGAFSLLTFYFSHFTFFTGSQGIVVVLLLQINRVPGHDFLCFAEKNQSDYFSSCISSCLYV